MKTQLSSTMDDGSPAQTVDAEGLHDGPTPQRTCRVCGEDFEAKPGPATRWCPACRPGQWRLARKVRYYADPEGENATRQRWREDNRERDRANDRRSKDRNPEARRAWQRSYENAKNQLRRAGLLNCSRCDSPLRKPSPSGLCGFCEAIE